MRVYTSQTAETIGRRTSTPEVGHLDLLRRADHYVFDVTLAVEQNADLTSGLVRDLGHLSSKFLRNDLCLRNASRRKTFYALYLVLFQPLYEARDVTDNFLRKLDYIKWTAV